MLEVLRWKVHGITETFNGYISLVREVWEFSLKEVMYEIPKKELTRGTLWGGLRAFPGGENNIHQFPNASRSMVCASNRKKAS